jgi:hypothetical protein
MNMFARGALGATLIMCAVGFDVRPAHAVGDIYLRTTGPGTQEVTLSITDPAGAPVPAVRDEDSRPEVTHIRDLPPGTYKVTVTSGGVAKPPQDLVVRDNQVNSYTVDRDTGLIAAAPVPQQQRQRGRFSAGILGGIKRTPYDGEVTSSALASRDSGDLDDTIGNLGVEGRYYFPRSQIAQLGADLFIAGTYMHYMGGGKSKYFGDRHAPVPGNDVGASVEEKYSIMLGVGASLNILQRVGVGLILGAHMTKVDVAALGNEFPVGNDNKFKNSDNVFGPFLAAEAFYTLGWLQGIGPVQAALRTTLKWMPDVDARGTSSLNFDYNATAEGGVQYEGQLGLRILF